MHPKPRCLAASKFSIDVTELSISVCAIEKKSRNKSPKHRSHRNKLPFSFGIFDKLLKPISNKKTAAKIIRKEPTCRADNPINPFLIKINELPNQGKSY
jgi:hypothetical protein